MNAIARMVAVVAYISQIASMRCCRCGIHECRSTGSKGILWFRTGCVCVCVRACVRVRALVRRGRAVGCACGLRFGFRALAPVLVLAFLYTLVSHMV